MSIGVMKFSFHKILQTDHERAKLPKSYKILGKGRAPRRCKPVCCSQPNMVGIIGGASAFSTLIFLEKLVWWSSRHGEDYIPFVVCSDPAIGREIITPCDSNASSNGLLVDNLRRKRAFLEQSGARCIIMPCYVCHVWHGEVSEGCSVPFIDIADCVTNELKNAKLKPLETGSGVKIGVIATNPTVIADFYQVKLQKQGFEIVLPDKATMEHTVIPAVEALKRKDREGAINLLRIGIQILLVRGVNNIIIASDEFQGLLPHDDPLLKKCIDPMDALARWTIKWAHTTTTT